MSMQAINMTINGEKIQALVEPRTHLGDFLRDNQRLTGTHLGCEHGVCGACTVLIEGVPSRACIAYAVACDGQQVRTIEGFEEDEVMAQLRTAFSRFHALQCGFCTPGMLISARDVVLRCPTADAHEVRVQMSGNLCRCTGYQGIINAIVSVIESRRAANADRVEPVATAARAPLPSFQAVANQASPAASVAPATASPTAAAATPSDTANKKPGTRIEDAFEVDHPIDVVWEAFADMPKVAACLPGAEITEHTPTSIKGKISTKFGPMRAAFVGSAALERNASTHAGSIRGAGTDSLSNSRARGDITYALSDAGNGRTRVAVAIEYSLQGPLAQFSRGGLVKEFVKKMVADFAANLNARLGAGSSASGAPGEAVAAPAGAAPMSPMDAAGVFWRWMVSTIKSWF